MKNGFKEQKSEDKCRSGKALVAALIGVAAILTLSVLTAQTVRRDLVVDGNGTVVAPSGFWATNAAGITNAIGSHYASAAQGTLATSALQPGTSWTNISGLGSAATNAASAFAPAISTATQAEAEAGTEAGLRSFSPLRIAQAIAAIGGSGGGSVISVTRTVFVDLSGNDSTAAIGDPSKPFLTAQAAYNAVPTSGSNKYRMVLGVGDYTITLAADWNPNLPSIIGTGTDSTSLTINGNGANGSAGSDGVNGTFGANAVAGSNGADGTVSSPYGANGTDATPAGAGTDGTNGTDGEVGGTGKSVSIRADFLTCTINNNGGNGGPGGNGAYSGGGGSGASGGSGGIGYTVVEGDSWNLSDPETYYVGYKFSDGMPGSAAPDLSSTFTNGGSSGNGGDAGQGGDLTLSGTAIFYVGNNAGTYGLGGTGPYGGGYGGSGSGGGTLNFQNIVIFSLNANYNPAVHMFGCLIWFYNSSTDITITEGVNGNHTITLP